MVWFSFNFSHSMSFLRRKPKSTRDEETPVSKDLVEGSGYGNAANCSNGSIPDRPVPPVPPSSPPTPIKNQQTTSGESAGSEIYSYPDDRSSRSSVSGINLSEGIVRQENTSLQYRRVPVTLY